MNSHPHENPSPAATAIQDAARKVREGELLRVGQLAERSGRSIRALHLYEELGLLSPAGRTKGGFRLYDESALLRVEWIDRLQELGFTLKDAADFLSDLRGEANGPAAMLALRSFYLVKLAETRAAIERLGRLEAELSASLDYLQGCRSCDDQTPRQICPSCTSEPHIGTAVPPMVAAVHDPS